MKNYPQKKIFKMLKILHIHPNFNMAKKFVFPLIELERSEGHSSSLIYSADEGDMSCRRIAYDISSKNIFGWVASLFKLFFTIFHAKPDIVICHNSKAALFPLIITYILGVKRRVYFNHGVPFLAYNSLTRIILKIIELSNLKCCTHAVTVSEYLKLILNDIQKAKHVEVIGNGSACGIDLQEIKEISSDNSKNWRLRNGFKAEDFIIVYIGRPEIRKGFKHVIDLWRTYKFENNFHLVICGPNESDVRSFCTFELENTKILGFVDNIIEILSGVDLVILPSFHEGLPYVLLEAMACGCVIIANNTYGINTLIRHGHNGYLVDNNELESFYNKILYAHRHKPELLNIINNAKNDISKYDRKIFLERYSQYINDHSRD